MRCRETYAASGECWQDIHTGFEASYLNLPPNRVDTAYSYRFPECLIRHKRRLYAVHRDFRISLDKLPAGDYFFLPSPVRIGTVHFQILSLELEVLKLRNHEPSTICGETFGDYEDQERRPLIRKATSLIRPDIYLWASM
jgi:hypothetical protein